MGSLPVSASLLCFLSVSPRRVVPFSTSLVSQVKTIVYVLSCFVDVAWQHLQCLQVWVGNLSKRFKFWLSFHLPQAIQKRTWHGQVGQSTNALSSQECWMTIILLDWSTNSSVVYPPTCSALTIGFAMAIVEHTYPSRFTCCCGLHQQGVNQMSVSCVLDFGSTCSRYCRLTVVARWDFSRLSLNFLEALLRCVWYFSCLWHVQMHSGDEFKRTVQSVYTLNPCPSNA